MKLLSRNAEELLMEKVRLIAQMHDSWRCIYVKFPAGGTDENIRAGIITGMIRDLLGDDEGFIYLCNDGDVFVLFQGQTTPVLSRLGGHFKDLELGGESARDADDQYTVFDLSKHWDGFLKLCKSKYVAAYAPKPAEPVKFIEQKDLPDVSASQFGMAAKGRKLRKRLMVLLVEDDPFTRRLVKGTLKDEFDVIEAGSGIAAVKAYESYAPDAVFLDIELPDVNGHVLLNKFLGLDKSAFVVMLSANSVKENILGALEKGAQGFVAKPFVREKLINYLRACESARKTQPVLAGA